MKEDKKEDSIQPQKKQLSRYAQARKNYAKTLQKGKFSREQASEELKMSPEKLEKIENGKLKLGVSPQDIVNMANLYKDLSLCSYYCASDCEIGKMLKLKEVEYRDIKDIALKTLGCLNKLNKEHNELINITEDGNISDKEKEKFYELKSYLDEMADIIHCLKLWYDQWEKEN